MIDLNLNKEEKEILKNLSEKGPLTPLDISVEQLKMPEQVNMTIHDLVDKGLILVKQIKIESDSELVTLTDVGREIIKKEMSK
jgi:DNA-binding MarR family transcriptional regulator